MSGEETLPEIEQEIERTRADLDETLDRLREKLDPASHMRHAADELGRSVASLYGHEPDSPAARREIGRLIGDNILPLAVIAAGCAWLVAREVQRSRRSRTFEPSRFSSPYPEAPLAGTETIPGGPAPAGAWPDAAPGAAPAGVAEDPLSDRRGPLR
jgi:hypothetical protein